MTSGRPGSDAKVVRQYHAHLPGLFYITVTIFLAVGAINGQNNLLFWAFGAAVGGLLLSGIVSGAAMMGIDVHRTAIDEVAAGEPMTIEYRVANTGRRVPAFALSIAETAKPSLTRKRQRSPKQMSAHTVSRPVTFVAHVPAGGGVHTRAVVVPEHCGLLRLDWVTAVSSFPFGLVRKSTTVSRPGTTLVLPRKARVRPDLIEALGAVGIAGLATVNRAGTSDDFYGLREYQDGESLRRIAWKPSARTGELLTRQFAAPAPKRVWVVLDIAAGQTPGEVAESAVTLAANVARQAHAAGYAVGLRVSGSPISHRPKRAAAHLLTLLRELAMVDPSRLDPDLIGDSGHLERNDSVLIVHAGEPLEDVSAADVVLNGADSGQYLVEQHAEPELGVVGGVGVVGVLGVGP